MKIIKARGFINSYKRLHKNQLLDVDNAIRAVADDPSIGDKKMGDLSWLSVYKFKMVNQLTLLAYTYNGDDIILTLVSVGTHENFYRNLKR